MTTAPKAGAAQPNRKGGSTAAPQPAAPRRADGSLRFNGPVDDRQAAIVAMGRRAIASSDVSLLLQDAAALLAETLSAEMSGVAEILPDGRSFVLRLASTGKSSEPAVMQEFGMDQRQSLAAYTLGVAHPVIVENLAEETQFVDTFLRRNGICSAICCPLQLLEQSFGALAVYSTSGAQFSESDMVFVEVVAHLVSTTIGRDRLTKELEQERRLARLVVDSVGSLVLTLTPEGKVVRSNPAFDAALGFAPDELKDRPIWNAFLLPADVPPMLAAFDQLRRGQMPKPLESNVVTKRGEFRQIRWTLSPLEDHRGKIEGVVATGTDLTPGSVEEQCQEAQSAADESRQELRALGNASIAEAFKPSSDVDGSERRTKLRRAYPYVQLVAQIKNGELPPRGEFREVRCRDISAGGFSFTSSWCPTEKSIVAGFGSGKSLIYLVAEIRHCRPVKKDGKPMYLVGCRYTGRVTY